VDGDLRHGAAPDLSARDSRRLFRYRFGSGTSAAAAGGTRGGGDLALDTLLRSGVSKSFRASLGYSVVWKRGTLISS